jgi:hypothetical protein
LNVLKLPSGLFKFNFFDDFDREEIKEYLNEILKHLKLPVEDTELQQFEGSGCQFIR